VVVPGVTEMLASVLRLFVLVVFLLSSDVEEPKLVVA
jgi:hypothetical protein